MATRPLARLRELALSLERAAVEGAVDGAVDPQVRSAVREVLSSVARLAQEAAEADAGGAAHDLAAAATRGALEELEREWASGGLPLADLAKRLDALLDRGEAYLAHRTDFYRPQGEHAHAWTSGALEAAAAKLGEKLPELQGHLHALAPAGGQFAFEAGRGLVRGIAAGLREELRGAHLPSAEVRGLSRDVARGALDGVGASLRNPAVAAAGAAGATLALALLFWRR